MFCSTCLFRVFVFFQWCLDYVIDKIHNYGDHRRFFISSTEEYDPEFDTHVPEGAIFVEEWKRGRYSRRRILHEGEAILPYEGDPWRPVVMPWVWIGDTNTQVDLTTALSKYMIPGNLITYELISTLCTSDEADISFIDARTFIEHDFPAEGVRIRALNAAR